MKTSEKPFVGDLTDTDVVAIEYEVTENKRVGKTWWGKLCIEHEVVEWVIIDEGFGTDVDIVQYSNRKTWVR